MPDFGIPFCCNSPLESFIKVPGYEYRCTKCGTLYEFFDGFKRVKWSDMTTDEREAAKALGWIEPAKEMRDGE